MFCFSTNTWEWASNFEVFTLNNLLCILLLSNAVDYFNSVEISSEKRQIVFKTNLSLLNKGIILAGLALANQHTSILFILPLVYLVVKQERMTAAGVPVFHAIKIASIPLSLYLYLPFSSLFMNARLRFLFNNLKLD